MSEVRAGYNKTMVGVIPEEWKVSSIGEVSTCFSGGTPNTSNSSYYGGNIPWITSSDLNSTRIKDVQGRITAEGFSNSAAKIVSAGTVLLALYGATAGVCAITEIRSAINQAVLAICPEQVNTDYLFQFLHWRKDFLIKTYTQGGQPNFSGEIVKSFFIPLPSLTEQRAIASALSDVDALIAALDRLIAKKSDLKQAAMQQLLTGQTRLPGYRGEWEKKRLGDVGSFLKGKGIKKTEVVGEGLPCVRYGEIYTHHNEHLKGFNSFITLETARQSQRIQKGDLLFAGSGETAEEIGKCVAYLWDLESYAGGDIVIFRPQGQSSDFLGYLMNHSNIVAQKTLMGQGDAVVHISARNLARLELYLPPVPEQTAIAAVLSDMDAEIAALERRREKTRALKQGMMQELLTGRTQLV